ncbi:hypothetical protein NC651_025705 [Populus alba x Populus x berolinensis]|nr:hypothetical protein NC651_025705 [Populus alba x Populus x berolinensis]
MVTIRVVRTPRNVEQTIKRGHDDSPNQSLFFDECMANIPVCCLRYNSTGDRNSSLDHKSITRVQVLTERDLFSMCDFMFLRFNVASINRELSKPETRKHPQSIIVINLERD